MALVSVQASVWIFTVLSGLGRTQYAYYDGGVCGLPRFAPAPVSCCQNLQFLLFRYDSKCCLNINERQCYCDPVLAPECIAATASTTAATPTTAPPTTTTTPSTTPSTPSTTPSTPSTTPTTPSTTPTTPSTTPTTPSTTLAKVCPTPIQTRLLGSTPVSGCDPGVIGIWTGSRVLVCNAVYATDPKTLAPIVLTLNTCYQTIQAATRANIAVDLKLNGSQPLGYASYLFKNASSVSNVTRLENTQVLTGYFNPTGGVCVAPACVYNPATMILDTSSCYIASYGASQVTTSGTSYNGAVNTITVQKASSGCPNLQAGTDQVCFVSTNGGANCQGDSGAPVYCKIQTGETVLYGLNILNTQCGSSVTYFSVEPIPSF